MHISKKTTMIAGDKNEQRTVVGEIVQPRYYSQRNKKEKNRKLAFFIKWNFRGKRLLPRVGEGREAMWKVCSDPSRGVGNREKLFEKRLVIFINKY